ncbi:MAG: histidinol dehydrogenase [Bacteroidales bacterium]|nr:histidinol dehydrogenase [Bacteroidales bacterium]
MKTYNNINRSEWPELCRRPQVNSTELGSVVNQVFDAVHNNGDTAVLQYTEQFDNVKLESLLVTEDEWAAGVAEVPLQLQAAIQQAKKNIETFHSQQVAPKIEVETESGVVCWQETRGIQKVGLYIPGGSAPLFSTVLMLAVPAKLAGCEEVVLCTPPDKRGNIAAAILYAAEITGVTKIVKAGGIQAIAALTYGTESVPQVYKIFGPGNQYVTAAKQKAFATGTAIDLPAGPSEVLVLADESAVPAFVASDLLSQAEHGMDSQVVLVSLSENLPGKVSEEIEKQLPLLPRADIARKALENARLLYFKSREEALGFVNAYAPEHFIVSVEEEDYFLNNIQNAGSVFIGNYSPESAGDYLSGTNHTLPTNGFARSFGSLGLADFTKKISFQRISKTGLQNIGNSILQMARAEGLEAHAQAVELRMKSEK